MPVETLTSPPDKVEAGNTVIFTESYSLYPTSAWTLAFVLILNGKVRSIAASISGTKFSITLPTDLKPGVYDYAEYVTETASGQRTTARTGTIEVMPDLTKNVEPTFAAGTLEILETAIGKLSKGTNLTVNFNGQNFTKKDLKALREERTYWKAEVLRERSAADGVRRGHDPRSGRIAIQFAPQQCGAWPAS